MDDLVKGSAATAAAKQQTADNGQPIMHVKIYSPFKVYFDETALSISAENETGPFDVLPRHHNFITLLKACELVVRQVHGADQRIRISGGIMHVKADQVIIFLDV
jgi:F-type H+-transporting ATPase subunit epsilon